MRYQRSLKAPVPGDTRAAHAGIIQSALRIAEFSLARTEADALVKAVTARSEGAVRSAPTRSGPRACSTKPRSRYRDALSKIPELPRGHHGMARALAARGQLEEAMNEAQLALKASPRDLEDASHGWFRSTNACTATRRPPARTATT